jgi:hypothetical protein
MAWDRVDSVAIFCVDVWIVFVLFSSGVVLGVQKLVVEVVGVSDAMLVIAAVPDFSRGLLPDCEGVAAFDVLNAFGR